MQTEIRKASRVPQSLTQFKYWP